MLVDNERQQILAIHFLQKSKRQGFNLLPHVVERVGGIFAERFFDQRFGDFQAAGTHGHGSWRGVGKFVDNGFLLVAAGCPHLGDFDRDGLDLLGVELRHQLDRFFLGKAGQQNRGFA